MKTKRKTRSAASKKRAANAAYQERLEDLKAATRTIGDTNADRLAWLVNFIAEDPKTWHSATRAERGDCLVALGTGGYLSSLVGEIELPSPLAPAVIGTLHREMREKVRSLVGGDQWVHFPTGDAYLARFTDVGESPAQYLLSYGHTTPRAAIFHAAKDLILGSGGDRLLACPKCGTPFVRVRRQVFCSRECAQDVRNERKATLRKTKKAKPRRK